MKNFLLSLIFTVSVFMQIQAKPGADIGEKAPEFNLKSLTDNSKVTLAGLKGKVVLLDFWASWCAPCKISMPHLDGLSKKYKNFVVIAVNVDDDKQNAIDFLKEMNLDINAVHDSAKEVVSAYDVPEMPTAYLIDQYGVIQYMHSGYSQEKLDKLEFAIRGLIDRK